MAIRSVGIRAWDAPASGRLAARYDAPADRGTTRLDAPAAERTVVRAPADRLDGRKDAPAPRAAGRTGWIA